MIGVAGGVDLGRDAAAGMVARFPGDDPTRPPRVLLTFRALRGSAGARGQASSVVDAVREKVRDAAWGSGSGRLALPVRGVASEKPPTVVSAKVKHGPQAAIGWSLGWLGGRIAAGLDAAEIPCGLVTVSTWRATMLERIAAWTGRVVEAPSAAALARSRVAEAAATDARRAAPSPARLSRVEDGPNGTSVLMCTWEACGHTHVVPNFDLLRFSFCPVCAGKASAARTPTPEELVTEAWKKLAVDSAIELWSLSEVVAGARKGCRANPGRDPHLLPGIPDVCEALWVSVHALEVGHGDDEA